MTLPQLVTVTLNAAIDRLVLVDELHACEVLRAKTVTATPGGKGLNVARIAKRLGAEVTATGFLAGHAGQFIEDGLRIEGVDPGFVWVEGESRQCLNFVDTAGRSTEVLEPGVGVGPADIARFREQLREVCADRSLVVLSGSMPPGCEPDLYALLVNDLSMLGSKVFFDSSGESLLAGLKSSPFFVKPNADEASELVGQTITSPEEAGRVGADLRANYGVELVVISLGPQGAVLSSSRGEFWAQPPQVPVVNTVGCGDALVAAFATEFASTGDPVAALLFGVEVSAAAAMSERTGYLDSVDLRYVQEQGIVIRELYEADRQIEKMR